MLVEVTQGTGDTGTCTMYWAKIVIYPFLFGIWKFYVGKNAPGSVARIHSRYYLCPINMK